jgi:hypothetical protein
MYKKLFQGCDIRYCNLLAETKHLCWRRPLSCLLYELQKHSSSVFEFSTTFEGRGFCFCNLFFETNSFGLGTIFLSCLVSVLREPLTPGLELRQFFRIYTILVSLSVFKAQAYQVWCKLVYPFSSYKRTYIHTQHFNFVVRCINSCKVWLAVLLFVLYCWSLFVSLCIFKVSVI